MRQLLSRIIFSRISVLLVAAVMMSISALTVTGQDKAKQDAQSLAALSERPIHVTTRIFQMMAKRDSYQELND
ncbi:MAG: hypothetical protein ACRD82_05530, partial [Blastocatellia bacterium]